MTEEERKRFVQYCEQTAHSCGQIIDQLKRMAIPELVIQREQQKQAAYLIVAQDLSRIETQSIRG